MNTKYVPVSAYINKDFMKALKIIKGLGPKKIEAYGDTIIKIVDTY